MPIINPIMVGKSAYQQAVDGGYAGTEAEFQAILATGPWMPVRNKIDESVTSETAEQETEPGIYFYFDGVRFISKANYDGGYLLDFFWADIDELFRKRVSWDNGLTWGPDAVLYDTSMRLSRSYNVILKTSNWSGTSAPYTQTISVSGLTAAASGDIGLAQTATAEQRAAARAAMLCVTGQAAGTLTITADGDKPTVDIPVTVTILS